MAKANDPRIKVTYRIRGDVARKFHLWAFNGGLKKDRTVERLISGLVDGKIKL